MGQMDRPSNEELERAGFEWQREARINSATVLLPGFVVVCSAFLGWDSAASGDLQGVLYPLLGVLLALALIVLRLWLLHSTKRWPPVFFWSRPRWPHDRVSQDE